MLGQATRAQEEFVTELRYVPEGWFGVGAAALVIGLCWMAVWMYRREGRRGASMRTRMILAGLRCLVLVGIALILLEPVRVRILRKWIDSFTLVLVDASSSMDLTDRYRRHDDRERVRAALARDDIVEIERADLVDGLLSADQNAFVAKLAKNNQVKLYAFGSEPSLRASVRAAWDTARGDDTEPQAAESAGASEGGDENAVPTRIAPADAPTRFDPTGATTNIERAVRRVVDAHAGSPIAGVVVISDGGFNQGASAEDTARYAQERRVPLYVVGVGDPAPPQNIRVAEVGAPNNVLQNDPFEISAKLSAEGLDGETAVVRLRETDTSRGGEGGVVESRTVNIRPGGAIDPIRFERTPGDVGRYVYTVEVPALDGESVADDNQRQTSVNVIDARTRVLLLAGQPSWEYRYLSRLLQRDESFDLSCWLQSADLSAVRDGNTIIDHLPDRAEELFEYDAILMLDPRHTELSEEWALLIDRFVTQYGGGVLYAAQRTFTPDFFREPSMEPIRALLPVSPEPEYDLLLNQIGHYQTEGSPIIIPDAALTHPILQLGGDKVVTRSEWDDIASVYWHFPVLREKPAATVLMRHGDPSMRNSFGAHVLAAVQFVGSGRAGFLAMDGTWRWRRYGVENFDRFWVQFTRYLAEGRLLGGARRGVVLTERDDYSLGEVVEISARLYNKRFEPLEANEVSARYEIDGERYDFTLQRRRDDPGWYEGRFVPPSIGAYKVSVLPPREPGAEQGEIVRELRVSRPNIEILRPQMNRADLVALAEGSFGGKYFEVDEVSEIPSLIPDLHAEIPVRSRPTTIWDNGWVLAALIVLLSAEWAIRKWNRLL